MQTLSELLRAQARHFREKTFLVFEDKSWTYGTYFAQVEKLAQVLVDHGVVKGQPVCLYLPNRPELAFAYHACQLIGAIAVPMSAMYRSAELNNIMVRSNAAPRADATSYARRNAATARWRVAGSLSADTYGGPSVNRSPDTKQ
jgi:acyl-CoA synthetase (AMP-forming)/AMP-acid ligase II